MGSLEVSSLGQISGTSVLGVIARRDLAFKMRVLLVSVQLCCHMEPGSMSMDLPQPLFKPK